MNKVQSKDQEMGSSTHEVLMRNQSAWNGKVALSRKVDQLAQDLAAIALSESLTTPNLGGYAEQKKAVKQLMSEAAFAVAAPLGTFARDTKNLVLEKEVDYQLTNLSRAQDTVSKNRSQLVNDRAQSNLSALADYDIVADQLTALQQLITHFDDLLTLPRAMRKTQKTATANLKKSIKNLLQTLYDIDGLMVQFKTSTPTFYQTYTNARQKNKSASRSVNIKGSVSDASTGVPLPKVDILVSEKNNRSVSSSKGSFRFSGLISGNYTLQVSREGYLPQTIANVAVTDGKITRLSVVLVKSVTS